MGQETLQYRIIDFDKKVFYQRLIWIFAIAVAITIANQLIVRANLTWMKTAENSLLFFITTILTGLYFGILIAVFLTGSDAWKNVVKAVRKPNNFDEREKEVAEALAVTADPFLAYGLTSVWIAIAATGMFLNFPLEVCWLLTSVLTITGMLTVFAFDYWGFESGIKRIECITDQTK